MAFSYYRTLTFDHTQVPSDQSNIPMVLLGTVSSLKTVANGGHVQSSSGWDIVFSLVSDGSSPINWEIVSWDASTGAVEYWLQVPTLSASSDTVIYLCYGDASITTDQSATSSGLAWDTNYVAVYHFGTASSLVLTSSGQVPGVGNVNLTATGSPSATAGLIGGAFDGTGSTNAQTGTYGGGVPWPSGHAACTLEMWLQTAGSFPSAACLGGFGGNGNNGDRIDVFADGSLGLIIENDAFGFGPSSPVGMDNSWHLVAVGLDGSSATAASPPAFMFFDGSVETISLIGSGSFAISNDGNARLSVATIPQANSDNYTGLIDEYRVSSIKRSSDWLTAQYNNTKPSANTPAVGSEQTPTGPQTVSPSGIASGVAFGTASLSAGAIRPGGIPSALAFGVPLVAPGYVAPFGIPTGVKFGTPFINAEQIVTPALSLSPLTTGGIPSGLAFGSPRVAHVQVIEPALSLSPLTLGGIASGFAAGIPTVKASKQYLNVGGIASGFASGTPTLTGGVGGPVLYIAGVNVNKYWCPQGAGSNAAASTITSQTIGRATLTLDMYVGDGSGYQPVVGQTIRVQEDGATVFGGCIDTIALDWENSGIDPQVVIFHVTALDKASICDRRVVTQAAGSPYTAGSDVVTVILDICTRYLNGEGITTQDLPATGTLGNLTSDLPLNYTTVTDAFNQIATLSGTIWWIDFFSALHFSAFSTLPPAPFSLSATSGQFRNAIGFTSLSGNGVTNGYRNVQYVVTNLNVLPGAGSGGSGGTGGVSGVTETYQWTSGQPGVITFPNGTMLLEVLLPIGSVVSMTVNGVLQTVVSALTAFGTIATDSGPDLGDFGWVFLPGNNTLNPFLVPVTANATIVITYVPGNTTNATAATVGTALVPTAATGATFGTCGSGTFEAVAQVQDISDQADLNAIAAAELAKSGGIPQYLTFETDKPGLFVGQLLTVNLPAIGMVGYMGASISLLITSISARAEAQPLQYGSLFHWDVTAISNHDPGNWVTYFGRLIAMAGNPQPVLQYEVATFILAPSGSLSSGTVNTNPTYVDRTGLMVEIYGGAGTAPQNQNLVLTVTDVTRGFVLGSITIPAGSTAQITTAIPSTDQLYVYAKDQLTITATYQVTGANPVAAANVTVKVRWAM